MSTALEAGGVPEFPCAFCEHSFTSKEKLDLHATNFHPGQDQPAPSDAAETSDVVAIETFDQGENKPDAAYDRSDLKRLRNKRGEARLVGAIQSTALLHGTNAYAKAIETALSEHGVATRHWCDPTTSLFWLSRSPAATPPRETMTGHPRRFAGHAWRPSHPRVAAVPRRQVRKTGQVWTRACAPSRTATS